MYERYFFFPFALSSTKIVSLVSVHNDRKASTYLLVDTNSDMNFCFIQLSFTLCYWHCIIDMVLWYLLIPLRHVKSFAFSGRLPQSHQISGGKPDLPQFHRSLSKKIKMNSDWPFSITRLDLHRLLRLFMAKFVLMRVIKSATDLTNVSFADRSVQLDDDILAAVMAMRTMLADSDDLADSVRHFYVAIVEKMVRIFQFHDTVLKDISVLNPDPKLRDIWSPTMVRIWPLVSALWQMMKSNISWKSSRTINWVRLAICQLLRVIVLSTRSGTRWVTRRHLWGQIDTDSRSQLGNDTLLALLSCKINTDDPCYAFVPDKDLCKTAKVATWNYVREHQWSSVSVLGDMNVFLFWFLFCWLISCKLLSNNKILYSLSWKVLCYLRPPDLCINPLFTYNARFSETLRFAYKSQIFWHRPIYV